MRQAAERDVSLPLTYYLEESAPDVAPRLVRYFESSTQTLSEQPQIGWARFAHELDLPGLRSWPVGEFPYLIFYVELDDHVQVWRVLHVRRDLAAWLDPVEE